MKALARLLTVVAVVVWASVSAHAATITATDCTNTSPNFYVQAAINASSDGDTVIVPDGNNCNWSSSVTVDKSIIFKTASGCTLGNIGVLTDIPTGCATKIKDNVGNTTLLTIQLPACVACGKYTDVTGFEFQDGGAGRAGAIPFVISGQNAAGAMDDRRLRFHHNFINAVKGNIAFQISHVYGVGDHNQFTAGILGQIYLNHTNHDPTAWPWSIERWAEALASPPLSPSGWGTDKFMFWENNNFSNGSGSMAMTDGDGGGRYVVRFNQNLDGQAYDSHGTDSSTNRGIRAVEGYRNTMQGPGDGTNGPGTLFDIRSGPIMVWGNTTSGYGSNFIAAMKNQRNLNSDDGFHQIDGSSALDKNGGSTLHTFTVSSATNNGDGTWNVVVTEDLMTDHEWDVRNVHKSGCIEDGFVGVCGGLILNTIASSNTLVLIFLAPGWNIIGLGNGDTLTVTAVDQAFDGGCMSKSTFGVTFPLQTISAFSRGGTGNKTATATSTSHGLSAGNWVVITNITPNAVPPPSPERYKGTFVVDSTPTADTFTYTMSGDPGANISGPYTFFRIPWTAGNTDQQVDPCYQWLNTGNYLSLPMVFSPYLNQFQTREDEHYADYYAGKTFNGTTLHTANANFTTVGVGSKAQLNSATSNMTVCTKNAAFWVSDEGEWDSTNPGADGQLYVCTATNTWTLYYKPYTFPHPLAVDVPPPSAGPIAIRLKLRLR